MTPQGNEGPSFSRYIESIGIGIESQGLRESFALVKEQTLVEGQDWETCRDIHQGRFPGVPAGVYTFHTLFRGDEAEQENT